MQADWIVKSVDMLCDGCVCFLLCCIRFGRFFSLQCCEEALRDHIVPAISLASHAGHEAECAEGFTEIIAGVLTATIGVKQRAGRRRFQMAGIAQRIEHQLIKDAIREAVGDEPRSISRDM